MPTYEYECGKCGHHFEKFQRMTEPALKRCPKCKAGVKRLVGTGAGIIFKGSGFYQTDYRSEGYKTAAKAEKSSTEAKAESKTEAKAATKTEPAKKTE